MNIQYIIIMSGFLAVGLVCSYMASKFYHTFSNLWQILNDCALCSGFLVAAIMLINSFESTEPVLYESQVAQSARTYDSIVVKATGWPEQYTKDINFLEFPVKMKKITYANKWGADTKVKYSMETIIPTSDK